MADDGPRRDLTDTTLAADLHAWRLAHPTATLTEIEAALDARLDPMRAALLAEVAAVVPDDDPRCPTCGGPLGRRGTRTRTLRTRGDAPLALTRSYQWCPACAAGVFPPR